MGSSGHAGENSMNAVIHMDGVGGKVELGHLVDEHGGFSQKHIPSVDVDAISSFTATHSGKLKRPLNIRITVGEIDPTTNGY